jgi:hypothetical protein
MTLATQAKRAALDPGDSFIGTLQASRLLGYSQDVITRWLQEGRLRGFQLFPNAPWRVSYRHVMQLAQYAKDQLSGKAPAPSIGGGSEGGK